VNLNSIKAMRFSISTSLIFFWHGINYHAITLKKLAYSLLQLYLILSMT
jgi:cell division protein FtsB